MRQRYRYYAYRQQDNRSLAVKRHHRSAKLQHLVFRVVNRFCPKVVVVIGRGSGQELMAALDTSISIRAVVLDSSSASGKTPATTEMHGRVSMVGDTASLPRCFDCSTPMVIVNNVDLYSDISLYLSDILNIGGVVMFTDLNSSGKLWKNVNSNLTDHGMTFAGMTAGVIVGLPHLPRQTYKLWL